MPLFAALAASLLLLSACGTEAGGDGITVTASDFSFDPTTVSADPGEEVQVTLENEGDAPHTFTAEGLGIDIQADGGDSASGTFTAPDEDATFEFVCTIHPGQMRGEIVVGAGGAGAGTGDDDDEDDSDFDNVTPGESPPEGTTEGEDEYDDGY